VADFLIDAVSLDDLRNAGQLLLDIEYAQQERKEAADKAKRLAWEAKHPTKAYEKARAAAIKCTAEPDMEEAREEAKENGESWGELKDDWLEGWAADNWGTAEQAEFEADFRDNGGANTAPTTRRRGLSPHVERASRHPPQKAEAAGYSLPVTSEEDPNVR
jgi:hypothetical protein